MSLGIHDENADDKNRTHPQAKQSFARVPKSPLERESVTVGIIGAEGNMGRMLRSVLEAANLEVIGSDPKRPDGHANEHVIEAADVVIVAVPLEETMPTIQKLSQYSRPGQLWLDVTSVKGGPVRAMLDVHPEAEVIGLHPLFGPGIDWRGQTVVVCPARCIRWLDWVQDLIQFCGANTVVMSPDRHDELMSVVQSWTHAMYFIGALCLRDLGSNLPDLQKVATPQFRLLWLGVSRLFAQNNPKLYFGIQASLPERTLRNLKLIAKHVAGVLDLLDNGDSERFSTEYHEARKFLGPDLLDESTEAFNRVIRFLADLTDTNSFEVVCQEDHPGLLMQIVSVLVQSDLNMTSLHSMPMPSGYRFRITTEQRRSSRGVQAAIGKLRGEMGWIVE